MSTIEEAKAEIRKHFKERADEACTLIDRIAACYGSALVPEVRHITSYVGKAVSPDGTGFDWVLKLFWDHKDVCLTVELACGSRWVSWSLFGPYDMCVILDWEGESISETAFNYLVERIKEEIQ